ncbi:hypothetical protein EV580_2147 [Mycobacterium sp. BK086]|nr:hypothetical protein EV580_2147 [Mycobacterium sp. BK086]
MRARVGVYPGRAVPDRQRVPGLLGARLLGGEEPALQPGDQVMHRAALPFGGADHSPNAAGLRLLTAALISLEG